MAGNLDPGWKLYAFCPLPGSFTHDQELLAVSGMSAGPVFTGPQRVQQEDESQGPKLQQAAPLLLMLSSVCVQAHLLLGEGDWGEEAPRRTHGQVGRLTELTGEELLLLGGWKRVAWKKSLATTHYPVHPQAETHPYGPS